MWTRAYSLNYKCVVFTLWIVKISYSPSKIFDHFLRLVETICVEIRIFPIVFVMK
jgi:hypothetical protein